MINTGKLRVYSSFPSMYHLLNSGEWMESQEQWIEIYEQKKHVKNRVKFRRMYKPKYVTEVQCENSMKFNYYVE